MMILGPFLMAIVPGIIILLLTWWFSKINLSLFVRIIPGILTVIAAIILFYIGFVKIRGFEGAGYGILAFFLIIFAIISFVMANKGSMQDKENFFN
ncbi:YesK family protein [Peribacillus loiseleuriae]|uniref:YesK family protein n=1 Tax=Peribacillus loiseleuriae TaxID=1679170 RepID=UPI003D0014C6